MSLLASVTLDPGTQGGTGAGIASWFEAVLAGPLAEVMDRERSGGATSLAVTRMEESEESKEFFLPSDGWGPMRQELMRDPETANVVLLLPDSERPIAHVRSSSIRVRRPNVEVQLLLDEQMARLDDGEYCESLVDFLVSALNSVNPAFGHVSADQPMTEKTNLDVVLGRKVRKSVAEARQFLRGYSWVTVCPVELAERLGGVSSLESSGAFCSVIPLAAGGVVLQATETIFEYSDEAMRRVFSALAPVLPPGFPAFDPANPDVRFVPKDARQLG
ncbi:hypothetical protein [Streptomyces chartreusis]|uniref:hypothetical protein n=1 Tax=Streptomyces chartreusis TaxID=1969 RepID=UPI00362E73BB